MPPSLPSSHSSALLILLASPFVFAATASGGAASSAPIRLEPFVTTVGRGERPLEVSVDPRAPAQPAPAHDGADVLKSVPGFSVIRKGGTDGDPVLRGLAGSRLGIQVDGECIYGGCGNRMDPPTAYVFPAAYDRITVVKGPQTVLHGPGNSAGVVLFERDTPRAARRETSLYASATAGAFGRIDSALDARAAIPSAQARLTATSTRAHDYTDGAGRRVHSAYRRWSANASAAWTPDARTSLEYSAARSDGRAAYADRGMDGVKFARDNHSLHVARTAISPLLASTEVRLYRNYVDHVMDNYSLRSFVPAGAMSGRAASNPDRLTSGGLAQLVLVPAAPARVTLGLDTQRNVHSLRSTANESVDPFAAKPRVRDAEFRQRGTFAEGAFTLTPAQRLSAGARFDRWQTTDRRATLSIPTLGSSPNPGAGRTRSSDLASGFARYEYDLASRAATLFTGLGRAQRFPDYWELFRHESATGISSFGTRPEITTQLDAGALVRRGPLHFSISAFASRLDDFILVQSGFAKSAPASSGSGATTGLGGMTSAPVPTTRTATVTRNLDAATWGGEADLGCRLAADWKLDASLAYVRGENKTDARPLAQLPPLETRLGLSYTRRSWSAGALFRGVAAQNRFARLQGNIVGQDLGRTPGFGVLALHASWHATARLRISAGADNLFDRTYAEHLSRAGAAVAGFAQTTRVNEPGRFLWLRLDFSG